MKRYRWNIKRFKSNVLDPVAVMLLLMSMSVVWIK